MVWWMMITYQLFSNCLNKLAIIWYCSNKYQGLSHPNLLAKTISKIENPIIKKRPIKDTIALCQWSVLSGLNLRKLTSETNHLPTGNATNDMIKSNIILKLSCFCYWLWKLYCIIRCGVMPADRVPMFWVVKKVSFEPK